MRPLSRESSTSLSASAVEHDKIVSAFQSLPAGGQGSRITAPSTAELDDIRGKYRSDDGEILATVACMSMPGTHTERMNGVERWIGRAAAICVHPVGAWRVPSRRVRLVLVFGYLATGYLVGLSAFFLLAAPPL